MDQASHFDSKLHFLNVFSIQIKHLNYEIALINQDPANIVLLKILVASLLSSLHQLKEENSDLEDNVDRLAHRRDHLLAVRARLMALTPANILTPQNTTTQSTPERPSQLTNGPSPANNRSTHSSPRNSAATVSPIRYFF